MPQVFVKSIQDDFLEIILLQKQAESLLKFCLVLPDYFKHWQQKLSKTGVSITQQQGLVFFLSSHLDTSLKVELADFWVDTTHLS